MKIYKKRIEKKKLADQLIIYDRNFHNGQHVWIVSDNTYLSKLHLCGRDYYDILEGTIREKNQKSVKVEVASEWIDDLLNFMLDGERDTEFGIKEANYGNRILCISRENAEKYIEKTKLIIEIHSRGLREKDFSLSQLHELQNYLERSDNDNAENQESKKIANILFNMSLDMDYASNVDDYKEELKMLVQSIDKLSCEDDPLFYVLQSIADSNTDMENLLVDTDGNFVKR